MRTLKLRSGNLILTPGDMLIGFGAGIRAIEQTTEEVRIGGYLVPFTDEDNKDSYDTYWDDNSYLGAARGNGQDCFIHHTYPLGKDPVLRAMSNLRLQPLETRVDPGVGLWAETIVKLSDAYESMQEELEEAGVRASLAEIEDTIATLALEGKFRWSSATAEHLIRVDENGYVRQWPIIEGSLTPMPGTPQNRTQITTLRAFMGNTIETPAGLTVPAGTVAPPANNRPARPARAITPQVPAKPEATAKQPSVRSDYFGDCLEQNMAMSAINTLFWAMRDKISEALFGNYYSSSGGTPDYNDIAELPAVLAEFSALLLYTIDVFVGADAAEENAETEPEEGAATEGAATATTAVRALREAMRLHCASYADPDRAFQMLALRASKVLSDKHSGILTEARDGIDAVLKANAAKLEAKKAAGRSEESEESSSPIRFSDWGTK